MHRQVIALCTMLLCMNASAHEMVPTYPELKPSHVLGVLKAEMHMFNKRSDVEYYEIGVFDKDWNTIPFVSAYRLFKLKHLGKVNFDVYILDIDARRAVYICSKSKVHGSSTGTLLSSRICSKFKK